MTLSLDDVQNKRFRLARKSGYEVAEVDDFLDQVQESFAQLIEENQTLKNQVGSLGGDGEPAGTVSADAARFDAAPSDGAPSDARPSGDVQPAGPPVPAEPETIVVTTSAEASAAVVRLVQMSTEHAEQVVTEANAEAERIRSEADSAAEKLGADSQAEAERLRAEAREHAEGLRSDAQSRADQLDAETEQRRNQMLGDLDAQRASLSSAIEDLRHFEQSFRANLSDHLHRHLDVLSGGGAEPADVPELAPVPGQQNHSAGGAPADFAPGETAPEPADNATAAGEQSGDAQSGDAQSEDAQSDDDRSDDQIETDPDATILTDTPRLNALLGGDQN
jgi:DivIVA domain-containing protein